MRNILMVLMLSFAWTTPMQAAEHENLDTGEGLLRACKVDDPKNIEEVAKELSCIAYIRGFVDALTGTNNETIYIPLGVKFTYEHATRVVIKFLENHPEKLHELSAELTFCRVS